MNMKDKTPCCPLAGQAPRAICSPQQETASLERQDAYTAPYFEFRVYSRKELGVIYFPWMQGDKSASRALTRTIYGDPELLRSLEAVGFRKGIRFLTPNMVKVLVDYLGSPEEFHAIH